MKNQKTSKFNEELPIEYTIRIEQLMDDLIDQKIIDWNLGYYLQSLKDEDRYWFEIWTKVYELSYLSMNGVMRMEEGKPVLDEDWVCEFCDVMRKLDMYMKLFILLSELRNEHKKAHYHVQHTLHIHSHLQ